MTLMQQPQGPEDEGVLLIRRLAARVAELRKERGLPRRVLSEMSGVSPRYLAQLEGGEGNISVLLLQRVAMALDVKIENLLAEEAAPDHEMDRVAALYRAAPQALQDEVRKMLTPQDPKLMRAGRICLIGLRGAGKSTLGAKAGQVLGLPFVELNQEIEQDAGMPLTEVMAFYGEAGYRRMEAAALDRVSARHDRMILAVAGGIVAESQTYARLLQSFHTIWIRTSPAEHMQRVRAQGDLRPMEGNPAAMAHLKDLLKARTPLYARAEAQIDTSNRTARTSLNDLVAVVAKHRFLEGDL